ncbi:MAG: glycosyltransferase family 4 protein [Candidatus Eisenbacteria bacterium]|nr:glycosyltransferase family 4 protein [Candidatus Eisenbacteria bacterium]
MRIGIDARWIFRELSGIGIYTREMIRCLADIDRENEYVLFFDRPEALEETCRLAQLSKAPNFSPLLLAYGPFSLRGQLVQPTVFRKLRLDVFHSPNYMVPLRAFPKGRAGRTTCVVNVHDVIPLLFRNRLSRSKKARLFPLYRRIMLEVGRRADLIITGSTCSRTDVLRELRIKDPGRVIVIPDGVDPRFAPSSVEPRTGDITILYVGRLDPYKNVPRLVEAFSTVRKGSAPGARLKIVGPKDERYPEAALLAESLGVAPFVEWVGYVGDEDLVRAYQQAAVLVLPSHYEGFGLPALEAMACGTPVICSNSSSLPEVVGDAALLVDPDNTDELVTAIARVLSDQTLRSDLREKGLRRAARFSWRHTAALTLDAYRSSLSRGAGEGELRGARSGHGAGDAA